MKIAIVVNPLIKEAVDVAGKVIKKISSKHEILLEEKTAKALGGKSSDISKADFVISFGGDGTVLRAHALAQDACFLGVNMGDRGFLAEVRKDEIDKALKMLLEGKPQIEERKRLRVDLHGSKIPEALNDVVVFTAVPGKTATLKVYIDGNELFSFRGDGLIIATPTGSTAYTKAAGGPVVFPDVECMILTPICPSSRFIPPIVIPSRSEVKVEIGLPGQECLLIVDGLERAKLSHGAKITVRISDKKAKFIKWGDFCRNLGEKIL